VDLTEIEQRARDVMASVNGDLVAAYLFGSVARDTASDSSDIDIGVLLRSIPAGRLDDSQFGLEGTLEKSLGRKVQVVVLNGAPPDLIHRVLRDGRLLLDRDPSSRIRFEVKSRNEYFDVLPFLNRYRRREAVTP
jgi:predicted nucleotidyltransferase